VNLKPTTKKKPMKTNPIQDYILKNERNVAIAAAVGEAWPEARAKIVAGFIDRLDARLKRKLKGWESERWQGEFFVDQWPGYSIEKPAWKYRSVAIQCGRYGDELVLGIVRETDDTRKVPLHAPLLSAVQKVFPSAKSSSWWEAKARLNSPAPDWRKPEVLWRMHTEKTFVEEVAEQLLEIAEVSAAIIDRLSRRK
jgi:hypothetical protein